MSSYDVIIIGTGAGGGTPAHRLAPSGKRILLSALIEGELASVERAPPPAQAVR
jgi:pyruvate/2-oxoglutarate dehydrogenase complex dihydrolipoamide dehydrogenase (E3) component